MSHLIKLRAPASNSAITVGGVPLHAAEDGSLVVPSHLVESLRSHGFTDWHDGDRDRLMEEAVARYRARLKAMSPDEFEREIGRALKGNDDDASAPIEPPPPGFDPAKVRPEHIDRLNRIELFAYLKHKGVQAIPPITGDKLRELAHRAAQG